MAVLVAKGAWFHCENRLYPIEAKLAVRSAPNFLENTHIYFETSINIDILFFKKLCMLADIPSWENRI